MKSANLLFIITGRNKMLARSELLARVVHGIALTVHDKSCTLFQFKEKILICFDSCKFLLSTSQQTHQRWYLVQNENWADVYLSTLFQRCQNNLETMLIELRRFHVHEPILFQRWNLVENESWAGVCLSTLFQRCFVNDIDRFTSIQSWWPNVVSTLIVS